MVNRGSIVPHTIPILTFDRALLITFRVSRAYIKEPYLYEYR